LIRAISALLEVDLEEAEFHGGPAAWGLEAKACRVNDGNDCHGHACIGQIRTASAAIIRQFDLEEVLVANVTAMTSSLSTCHHKLIFWGDLALNTSALLFCYDLVPDCVQVEQQLGLEATFSKSGTFALVFDQFLNIGVLMASEAAKASNSTSLLNKESNPLHIERALRVVNVNHGFSTLLCSVSVLFKVCPHCGDTLVDAAPSLDNRLLVLGLVLFERKWGFTNDKNLFVLHVATSIGRLQNGLGEVLYLCLWALSYISVVEID